MYKTQDCELYKTNIYFTNILNGFKSLHILCDYLLSISKMFIFRFKNTDLSFIGF